MENNVTKYLQEHGIAATIIQQRLPTIQTGCWFAQSTYGFIPKEVQERVALYTTLFLIIEDISADTVDDLKAFQTRLMRGERQPNPLHEAFAHCANDFRKYYGPFASDMIMKGTIDFISSCFFEVEHEGKLTMTKSTSAFPLYLRNKTGLGEVYAFFAFPESMFPEKTFLRTFITAIPDMASVLCLVNDILSFYKESVVGDERITYIYHYSHTHDATAFESLQHAISSTMDCVGNLQQVLAVDTLMRNNIDELIRGLIMFHCSSSRYKLWELGIQEIDEIRESVKLPTL